VAAVAVTTGVVAWRRRAVPVHTALVKRSDLLVRVLCDGRLEPPEGGELRTADGGAVAAIAVREGDRVRRGQLLVRLANPDLEARARDARGQVRQLQSDAAAGGDELDRERREAAYREEVVAGDRRLLAQGAVPRATLDADQLAWQQALDRVKEAEARLRAVQRSPAAPSAAGSGSGPGAAGSGSGSRSRAGSGRSASRLALAEGAAGQLERRVAALELRAPADGVVYGLPRAAGEMVAAGQLVASVTDPDHPHVRCRVDQPDLPRVAPGQRLIVTFNGLPDSQWDGTVRRVGTGLREAGGREVGEIVGELSDPVHTLPANAAVDVQVVVAQKRGALTVPRSALRRDDERYVYVVVHRHAHRRDVTVGLIGLSEVEILSGLHEGEQVVAEGPPSLAEDARVVEAKPQVP
jgi:multidrug efflux pump subunit AcrA (membrane-fusion protein)